MSYVYIKSIGGGVVTAPTSTTKGSIAVLNQNSGGFQHWNFTDDGHLVLESSSPELCLSVLSDPLQNGNPVFLGLKGASSYLQTWGYDSEKSQFYLLEDDNYLLDNGSGGPAGPTVFVSKNVDAKWTLQKPFGELFTVSPCHENGSEGCIQSGGECNTDWKSYFHYTPDSISMVAGNDCRTVSTADNCVFSLGEGGVTKISFDFDICESCHNKETGIAWFAFWIYSKPWENTLEVDFIESKFGPANNGLNTNFAGAPGANQVEVFQAGDQTWKGSIVATFTCSGANDVDVKVTNSVNSNVGTATLTGRDGYFFVLDTATGTTATDCVITISNVQIEGAVNN